MSVITPLGSLGHLKVRNLRFLRHRLLLLFFLRSITFNHQSFLVTISTVFFSLVSDFPVHLANPSEPNKMFVMSLAGGEHILLLLLTGLRNVDTFPKLTGQCS